MVRSGVVGVILAAGGSRRLGRPKQLLELDGRPILDIVLGHAARSRLESIVLVLGSGAERIVPALQDRGQRVVINPDYASGQSTSLRAGITALPEHALAVLVLLGDQPEVTSDTIDRLVASMETHSAEIVMPSYAGIPGNPVLFRRSVFPELIEISGDRGARDVINAKRDAVAHIPFPDLSPPLDVDTEEDYDRLKEAWARRPRTSS